MSDFLIVKSPVVSFECPQNDWPAKFPISTGNAVSFEILL